MNGIKTGIKIRVTPEQSQKVQAICFENGICWLAGKKINYLDKPFLFIDDYISYMDEGEENTFLVEVNKEVSAEYFIRTNGTCSEPENIIKEFHPPLEQNPTKGYMVFVEGKNTPRRIHETKESAETSAKRFGIKFIGSKVYVVEIVKEYNSKVIIEEVI